MKLHLGCGAHYLPEYVNVDQEPEKHSVMASHVVADVYGDITELAYDPGSIDEIRSHHVFEHFDRVTAMAQLIKWHNWLRVGGLLRIEVPDFEGCVDQFQKEDTSHAVKMALIRHLAGSHEAPWACHVDQWFPERFHRTLSKLGFVDITVKKRQWAVEPYLANIDVTAIKSGNRFVTEQLMCAAELFEESLLSSETALKVLWSKQLLSLTMSLSSTC